ncbi:MAG: Txe/YoeB family addiction module toxin [Chlorobium sp.]|nr:MAG: Txe/YoeB family addiction module toxin [Chlorobium sp.]
MGQYSVVISKEAKEDLRHWQKVGDKSILRKIDCIFQELALRPSTGTGKPEALRGNMSGCWSRRVNKQNRIVYEITENIVTVFVISAR